MEINNNVEIITINDFLDLISNRNNRPNYCNNVIHKVNHIVIYDNNKLTLNNECWDERIIESCAILKLKQFIECKFDCDKLITIEKLNFLLSNINFLEIEYLQHISILELIKEMERRDKLQRILLNF